MKPYYEHNGITIYHGDCRDVLPFIHADVALVDPPYGIAGSTSGMSKKRKKGAYISAFNDDGPYIRDVVVPVIYTLIERVGSVVVTPGNKHFCLYPQPSSFGVFYQPAAVAVQSFGNLDAQPIFYYGKRQAKHNMGTPCSFVLTETPDTTLHPCAKPIKAWRRLLSTISREGQTVIDPFMGSGTTLQAAKELGRRAIGIELEERYCEIAARRLSQEVLQLEAA